MTKPKKKGPLRKGDSTDKAKIEPKTILSKKATRYELLMSRDPGREGQRMRQERPDAGDLHLSC